MRMREARSRIGEAWSRKPREIVLRRTQQKEYHDNLVHLYARSTDHYNELDMTFKAISDKDALDFFVETAERMSQQKYAWEGTTWEA